MSTRLIQLSRSCTHCGAVNDAVAPFANFDRVTNESCDFPEYDLVQTSECLNCHASDYLYWHNSELERKHLEETKELLFFKSKVLSDMVIFDKFHFHFSKNMMILQMKESLNDIGKRDNSEIKAKQNAVETYVRELSDFCKNREKKLLSDEEQKSFRNEIDAEVHALFREFEPIFKQKYLAEYQLVVRVLDEDNTLKEGKERLA